MQSKSWSEQQRELLLRTVDQCKYEGGRINWMQVMRQFPNVPKEALKNQYAAIQRRIGKNSGSGNSPGTTSSQPDSASVPRSNDSISLFNPDSASLGMKLLPAESLSALFPMNLKIPQLTNLDRLRSEQPIQISKPVISEIKQADSPPIEPPRIELPKREPIKLEPKPEEAVQSKVCFSVQYAVSSGERATAKPGGEMTVDAFDEAEVQQRLQNMTDLAKAELYCLMEFYGEATFVASRFLKHFTPELISRLHSALLRDGYHLPEDFYKGQSSQELQNSLVPTSIQAAIACARSMGSNHQ